MIELAEMGLKLIHQGLALCATTGIIADAILDRASIAHSCIIHGYSRGQR